jgi:hypothetical protein
MPLNCIPRERKRPLGKPKDRWEYINMDEIGW